jgi:AAHS family 4-hydroxybenzoate transporter-like MFS transporter
VAGRRIDVEALIDDQKFGALALRVLLLVFLAQVADGYDVQVMSFAAPSLLKAWHGSRAAFAPVFSASLFGILVGAPVFGWMGDKIGRKTSVVVCSVGLGLMGLCCVLARDLNTLMILRFLAGIGMGGIIPNAVAIASELSPKRIRAGMTGFIPTGITVGGIVPGLLVAQLPPGPVFHALFLIGGVAPLVLAVLVAVGLPESISLLIRRGGSKTRIAALARQIDPRIEADPEDEFVLPPRPAKERHGLAALFDGQMALITPLLWVMFTVSLLCIYLLTQWMPLLLEASGFTAKQAAAANMLFQGGGAVSGVMVGLFLGRLGVRLVTGLFVLGLLSVAVVARAPLPHLGLAVGIAACGFCIVGLQCALNGTASMAYPTAIRARGLGMALGIGRVGSVIGPLLAGAMVASGVTSARDLFLLPLLPLAIGALASFVVMRRLDINNAAGSVA